MVVLHGLPIDHTCEMPSFEPVFESRSGWRRIYVDLPGMGRTPAQDAIRSLDDMADAVASGIDALVPGERFALAGQSFGGYIARGVVRRMPDRVLGLMLWVSAEYPRQRRHRAPRSVLLEDSRVMAGFAPEEGELAEAMVLQTAEGARTIKELLVPATKRANLEFLEDAVAHPYRVEPESRPFAGPSLIVCGRQDFWTGYKDQFALMDGYPRATFAAIDYSGHLLGVSEQNGLFRTLVGDWLDRMDRSIPPSSGGT